MIEAESNAILKFFWEIRVCTAPTPQSYVRPYMEVPHLDPATVSGVVAFTKEIASIPEGSAARADFETQFNQAPQPTLLGHDCRRRKYATNQFRSRVGCACASMIRILSTRE